jgi:Domain of unknown function (DUF4129)
VTTAVLWMWLGCSGGLGSPLAAPWGGSTPSRESAEVLEDPDYRFCHAVGADGAWAREDWCAWASDPEVARRCPGWVETCRTGATATQATGCDAGDTTAPPPQGPRELARPEAPPTQLPGCEGGFDIGEARSLLRWVLAIGVAALVFIVLRLVAGSFGARERSRPEPRPVAAPARDEPLPEGPSGDLLDGARAALAGGRVEEAVLLSRGAALRRLAEAGKLLLHRSRTDREYQRSLRSDPPLQIELRSILGAVEALRWGGRSLDSGRAAEVVRAAERIVKALAAVALLVASIPTDALASSYESDGEAALAEVLRIWGYDVGWRLTALSEIDDTTDVLVIDADHGVVPDEEQWEHIRDWVAAGGVLVALGDVSDAWVEFGARIPAPTGAKPVLDPAYRAAGLSLPEWPNGPEWVYNGPCRPLVGVDAPAGSAFAQSAAICLSDLGSGAVVAVADPRIVRNAGFVKDANVRFAGDLLYLGQSVDGWALSSPPRVQLATRMAVREESNAPSSSPLASLATSGLLLFLAQLLATWGLAMLHAGWPFAPLRDPREPGRVAFSEHVEALGTRWYRRRESGYALHRLSSFWLNRLGREGLLSAARRAGYPAESAGAWVQEIERAASAPPPSSRADIEHMEELWRVTSQLR